MNQSVEDFKIGFHVFRDNLKAYLSVVLFIILTALGTVIIGLGSLAFFLVLPRLGIILTNDVRVFFLILIAMLLLIFLIVTIFFSAFNGTLYGLSYDIMSSGDLYTEFRHAFGYFRRNWLSYIIISFPVLFVPMYYQTFTKEQIIEYFLFIFVDFFALLFITGLFSSVTAKGSLITAIKECVLLLKRNFIRIGITIGIWFCIFRTPYIIGVYIAKLGLPIDFAVLALLILNFILMMMGSLIGNPILSIVATRIYNTNIPSEN